MFKAIAGMNQSVIATSSRPAARSSQTRTSGCTAGLSQARSVGIITSASLARNRPGDAMAASSPELWRKCHRSGVGVLSGLAPSAYLPAGASR